MRGRSGPLLVGVVARRLLPQIRSLLAQALNVLHQSSFGASTETENLLEFREGHVAGKTQHLSRAVEPPRGQFITRMALVHVGQIRASLVADTGIRATAEVLLDPEQGRLLFGVVEHAAGDAHRNQGSQGRFQHGQPGQRRLWRVSGSSSLRMFVMMPPTRKERKVALAIW